MRVVLAPDSFKGTLAARDVVRHLRIGWLAVRPDDELVDRPMADGGEGTLDAVATARTDAHRHALEVKGPDGRPVESRWLLLSDGTAVVELASSSGLPLMAELDPLGAHTFGLGQVLRAATTHDATCRIAVALGGSASTDGGAGALVALGLRLLDLRGRPIQSGGAGLLQLATIDGEALLAPPGGGVELLTDVRSPLLGRTGAAAVFGPQKGATSEQIGMLERAMTRFADLAGGEPEAAGAGAAGGSGYGLATFWHGTYASGARRMMELLGLPAAVAGADLVITGEGRFDQQSMMGKVVGEVLDLAHAVYVRAAVIAGDVVDDQSWDQAVTSAGHGRPTEESDVSVCSLSALAGGAHAARADPGRYLEAAAADLARQV